MKIKVRFPAAWPWFLGVLGLVLLHGPMARDGFGRAHGNLIDGRLVALLLEHAHQWMLGLWGMSGVPGNRATGSFFDPTWLYYPYPDALTLTDTMLGAIPLYSPFRLAGISPLHALQLWMVLCSVLGYASMYRLARTLKMSQLGATLAAFLSAFAMPRVTAAHHPQLAFFFPTVLALLALIHYLRADTRVNRLLWLMGVAFLTAWQTWATVYLGLFLVLAIGMGCLAALAMHETRQTLLACIRRDWSLLGLAALVFAVLLFPLMAATLQHGPLLDRSWAEVSTYLPTPASLVFPHGQSLLYGRFHDSVDAYVNNPSESQLFAGVVALLAPLALWQIMRRDRSAAQPAFASSPAKLLLLTWAGLLLLMLGDRSGHSLWWLPWHIPGARGIRGVGRLGLFLLLLVSLALGWVATWAETRYRHGRWLVVGLSLWVVLENAVDNRYLFSLASHQHRVDRVARAVQQHPDRPCPAFFYQSASSNAWVGHVDAMWASFQTGVPTLNGWAGAEPPGWQFRETRSVQVADLLAWARRYQPSLAQVCLVKEAATVPAAAFSSTRQ